MVTCEQSVLFDEHMWLLAKNSALLDGRVWLLKEQSSWLDGCVWLLGKKACYSVDMFGYLRTKCVACWACLATWEQSVLFDGHVWVTCK